MYKTFLPPIINSGDNPVKNIQKDLEFSIIPMLMNFLEILFILYSLFCDSLLSLGPLIGGEGGLFMFACEPMYFLYVINMFWKGNGYFLKQINHFFTKHFCPTLITSLELFKPTTN